MAETSAWIKDHFRDEIAMPFAVGLSHDPFIE
jgi:hypothetical protein